MKYHIDTIPVWDAYDQKDQCPLCVLEYNSEKKYVDFFLGGSVMEPSTRIDVNRIGFCGDHFRQLYGEKNRLGLALITHTHLKETIGEFAKLTKDLKRGKKGLISRFSSKLTGKGRGSDSPLSNLLEWLDEHHHSCMICDRLENLLKRYAYTIIYLWQKDNNFIETLKNSKGFCLHHFALIMKIADETLSAKHFNRWIDFILPIQTKTFDQLEADLLWYTQKFDYRNQDKPWGNSRDALPRTLQTLSGKYMEPPASSNDDE
ncbi:MAG: DUF6062 family protein [Caldicoprobacterales bacterium]|jgi:hypothetical protein